MESAKEQAMLAQIILDQHPADKEIQHNEQRNDPDIQTISLPETRISSPKGKKYADITVPVEKDKETYLYFKNLVYHGKKNGDDNFILTGRKGTKGILVAQNDIQQKIHIQSTFNPYYFGRKDYIVKINHQTSKAKEKVRLNFLSPGEYEFDDISLITVPKKDVLAKLKERKKNSNETDPIRRKSFQRSLSCEKRPDPVCNNPIFQRMESNKSMENVQRFTRQTECLWES